MTHEERVKREYPTVRLVSGWFWEFDHRIEADGRVLGRSLFKANAWTAASFYAGLMRPEDLR